MRPGCGRCGSLGFSIPLRRPAAANQRGRRRSSQSRARSRARRNGGMSSAKGMRPSGNIHRPKTGRMARHPPMISRTPAGMRAQREGLPEPPGDRLHPARQAAKEPPQPSLRVGIGVIIARGHGVRAQAPEIDSPATARNPWFSLCRNQSSARQARSTVFAAASSASTIAWICSGLASRPRRRS
jgi:hypothetical protein